ncbi:MAG: TAXI family TRAP transporter solute-binding subunit [Candidatus Aminicenantes bacterium]|nr:TAXI family TRAP transporter solute-binding subunit [Candidatus Aminicenantes bacterium]
MKKKKIAKYLFSVVLFLLLIPGAGVSFTGCNRLDFVSIGTGAVTGIYYPTGGAICRMINKKMGVYKIKATVEATAGSVYNVNAVLSGDLEFGVVQSDRQYQAFHGLSEWKQKGPRKRLRAVFSIHPESVNLIVSTGCGVNHITELKGKRVNIGNPGSGPLQNARDALEAFGLDEKKDILTEYVKAVEAPGLLQDERIDAFFYTVGHPNGNIKEATSGRVRVKFLPIEGPQVEALIKKYPYYTKAVIPHKFYPTAQNKKDINSFGVRGTLVTSEAVDERIVYAVTKEIFENFEEFKSLHPAYADLTKKGMLAGLSAPVHRGALKYYTESNLIQHINKRLLPPRRTAEK